SFGHGIRARGFRNLVGDREWLDLASQGSQVLYGKGDRMMSQGSLGGEVLMLLSGRVKITYDASDGSQALLAIRGAGDLLGEFSSDDASPRSATVWAMEPCTCRRFARDRFAGLIGDREIRPRLDQYRNAKFRESADFTWRVANLRSEARIASLLLTVIAAAGTERRSNVVPMSQEELARSFGLARRTVSEILKDWKRRGLITTGRSRIQVLCPGLLSAIANP
ncbi:MAG: Crp/Fnr family transcriptional regulator, partial [Stackebrandtia sp.]